MPCSRRLLVTLRRYARRYFRIAQQKLTSSSTFWTLAPAKALGLCMASELFPVISH